MAPASTAVWRARMLPSSEMDLMSQCSQRSSGTLMTDRPSPMDSSVGGMNGFVMANTVGVAFSGKAWSRLATPRVMCM